MHPLIQLPNENTIDPLAVLGTHLLSEDSVGIRFADRVEVVGFAGANAKDDRASWTDKFRAAVNAARAEAAAEAVDDATVLRYILEIDREVDTLSAGLARLLACFPAQPWLVRATTTAPAQPWPLHLPVGTLVLVTKKGLSHREIATIAGFENDLYRVKFSDGTHDDFRADWFTVEPEQPPC